MLRRARWGATRKGARPCGRGPYTSRRVIHTIAVGVAVVVVVVVVGWDCWDCTVSAAVARYGHHNLPRALASSPGPAQGEPGIAAPLERASPPKKFRPPRMNRTSNLINLLRCGSKRKQLHCRAHAPSWARRGGGAAMRPRAIHSTTCATHNCWSRTCT